MENNSAPATKQDLIDLETRMVDRLTETIRDVETRLLTEFHNGRLPSSFGSEATRAAIRAVDVEMESLVDRIKELDGRND